MRVAIAGFHIESVSFLSKTSTYEDFEKTALRGESIIRELRDTNTVIGGMIEICAEQAIEMAPLVFAHLGALGPASDEAVENYAREIADGLEGVDELDGVLLHLHGASWARGHTDPEKYILQKVRMAVGPDIPVVVAFDFHGNIDEETVADATAAFSYQKSPHTDMGDTGRRAARCIAAILKGGLTVHMAVCRPNVLVPSIFSATALSPLAEIMTEARELEASSSGFLDISVMAGFSYADAKNTGFSVITVSGDSKEVALAIAGKLSERIYKAREDLYRPEQVFAVTEAVDRACELSTISGRPIVLLEHADRLNDSTYLLEELISRKEVNAAVPFIYDPEAARTAAKAGVGARTTVYVGGHSSDRAGRRLAVECEILQAREIDYRISGPVMNGVKVNLGLSALLKAGDIYISVVSYPAFAIDEDPFLVFGLNPRDFDIIVLRSKTHFRQVYEKIAERILIVDTPDYGPADLTILPYIHLDTRRVFPFVP